MQLCIVNTSTSKKLNTCYRVVLNICMTKRSPVINWTKQSTRQTDPIGPMQYTPRGTITTSEWAVRSITRSL